MKNISRIVLLAIFVMTSVFGLAGCSSDGKTAESKTTTEKAESDTKSADDKKADDKKADDKKAPETTEAKDDKAETAGKTDSVGVAECDEYIEKYEACINSKVPEAARATVQSAFETQRKSFRDMAANPSTKGALADACKRALETAKQTTAAYGCAW